MPKPHGLSSSSGRWAGVRSPVCWAAGCAWGTEQSSKGLEAVGLWWRAGIPHTVTHRNSPTLSSCIFFYYPVQHRLQSPPEASHVLLFSFCGRYFASHLLHFPFFSLPVLILGRKLHHHLESYRESTKSINNLSRLDIFITVSPHKWIWYTTRDFLFENIYLRLFSRIYLQICVVASIKILYILLAFLGNFWICVVNGAFLNYIF